MPGRVLVTGATSGIGEAIVDRLDRVGWTVHATARRDRDLERLGEAGLDPVRLDLEDEASIGAAAAAVDGDGLEAVVHNVGIGVPGAVEDLGPDAWRTQFRVNLFGPVELTRQLAPALREAGGRLVFVSSQAAIQPAPLYGAYNASKAALEAAADTLRMELAGTGVGVSLVQPGPVETGFQARSRDLLAAHVDVEASRYREAYEGVDERTLDAVPTSSVEDVVDAVERALTARRPPARVPVGRLSWLAARLGQLLPTRARDAIVRRLFGL
jgi:NAD(P)-dependent dehydrogenase (short-subunit alcohol dehydrogenase family)